jgi:hypothetical protein
MPGRGSLKEIVKEQIKATSEAELVIRKIHFLVKTTNLIVDVTEV